MATVTSLNENILLRLKCNKCGGAGPSKRNHDYTYEQQVMCNNCGHIWDFDWREILSIEKIIEKITSTKPPRIGYH